MKRLCTICARGGSKGVPDKNLRELLGTPLIVYSIRQAQASELFAYIAVSSDSDRILSVAQSAGATCIVKRPAELATDRSAKVPAIRHCVQTVQRETGEQYEVIVDLDCTSPLRSVGDIQGAVALLEESGAPNVITGTPARRSPYFNLVEITPEGTASLCKQLSTPVVRRQDAPQCFDMNASIYVWHSEALFSNDAVVAPGTRLYSMPPERSHDIDGELDFQIVEMLARQRQSLW